MRKFQVWRLEEYTTLTYANDKSSRGPVLVIELVAPSESESTT